MQDIAIIISLISLGFFGGFSHCIGMCGPFVISQTLNRLEKIPLNKFSNFTRLKNLALLPYHLGRITTYSILGATCSFLRKNIEDFTNAKIISALFLLIAALFFLSLFFENSFSKFKAKIRLPFKSKTLKNAALFFWQKFIFPKNYLAKLFKNPTGLRGYALGLLLGFIPCGLLYGACLIAASINNPLLAFVGMALFGTATFPALFLSGIGGYTIFKNSTAALKIIAKAVLLVNSVTLFIMAFSLIF